MLLMLRNYYKYLQLHIQIQNKYIKYFRFYMLNILIQMDLIILNQSILLLYMHYYSKYMHQFHFILMQFHIFLKLNKNYKHFKQLNMKVTMNKLNYFHQFQQHIHQMMIHQNINYMMCIQLQQYNNQIYNYYIISLLLMKLVHHYKKLLNMLKQPLFIMLFLCKDHLMQHKQHM